MDRIWKQYILAPAIPHLRYYLFKVVCPHSIFFILSKNPETAVRLEMRSKIGLTRFAAVDW